NQSWMIYSYDEMNRMNGLSAWVPTQPMPPDGAWRSWFTYQPYKYDAMNRLYYTFRSEDGSHDQFWYYLNGELSWSEYILPPGLPYSYRSFHYGLDKAGNRNYVLDYDTPTHHTTISYDPNHFRQLNQYDSIAHGWAIQNGNEHEISNYNGVHYTYLNDTHLAEATFAATENA